MESFYSKGIKEISPNEIILTQNPISYIIDSIHSNDYSFYHLSNPKSKNYIRIKETGLTNEKFVIKLSTSMDMNYLNNYLRTKNVKIKPEDKEVYNEKELRSWICCLHSL